MNYKQKKYNNKLLKAVCVCMRWIKQKPFQFINRIIYFRIYCSMEMPSHARASKIDVNVFFGGTKTRSESIYDK